MLSLRTVVFITSDTNFKVLQGKYDRYSANYTIDLAQRHFVVKNVREKLDF